MKRKLVKQGNNVLTVSMPSSWVKHNNLSPGKEVELDEKENKIIISKERGIEESNTIKLDLRGLEQRQIKWAVQVSYKRGYDELQITFDRPEIPNIIEHELANCPGFEIISQTEKSCVVKNIAHSLKDELDNSIRRNFLNSLTMIETCLAKIKEGNLEELGELIRFEKVNNKLCSLGGRLVNKSSSLGEKAVFLYVILWQLEKIIDEFKYICEYFSENPKSKISSATTKIFEDVALIFRKYYELYYKFELPKQVEITKMNKEIKKKVNHLISSKKGKENVMLYYLGRASERILECVPSTLALNSELFEIKS